MKLIADIGAEVLAEANGMVKGATVANLMVTAAYVQFEVRLKVKFPTQGIYVNEIMDKSKALGASLDDALAGLMDQWGKMSGTSSISCEVSGQRVPASSGTKGENGLLKGNGMLAHVGYIETEGFDKAMMDKELMPLLDKYLTKHGFRL